MELPALADPEGAYWYFLSILLFLVLLAGIYVVGVALGILPDPETLVFLLS
jgi:hypothetical protein